MTIREASENIGKLAFHSGLNIAFFIDSIADPSASESIPTQIKVRTLQGRYSYFHPEVLLLLPPEIADWYKVWASTPAAPKPEVTNTSPVSHKEPEFQVGDQVKLISGGPRMTVASIAHNVSCFYFYEGTTLVTVEIPAGALMLVESKSELDSTPGETKSTGPGSEPDPMDTVAMQAEPNRLFAQSLADNSIARQLQLRVNHLTLILTTINYSDRNISNSMDSTTVSLRRDGYEETIELDSTQFAEIRDFVRR